MKVFIISMVLFFFLACQDRANDTEDAQMSNTHDMSKTDTSVIAIHNFAVVWNWQTKDTNIVGEHSRTITNELFAMLEYSG